MITMRKKVKTCFAIVSAVMAACLVAPGALASERMPGCIEDVGCFRFLWPEDPANPGGEKVELRAEYRGEDDYFQEYDLIAPDNRTVATTRFYSDRMQYPEEEFKVLMFETKTSEAITGPTGSFGKTHFALPAITPPASHTRVLNFIETAFAPPTDQPVASTGPKVLYSDALETVVFSPLDKYLIAIGAPEGGEWHCGLEGLAEEIPAGYAHKVLVITGRGVKNTFLKWGELIRGSHAHPVKDPYMDVGIGYLGYYTDNGAYYYYKDAPGMNYHQTLIAVKEEADRLDIPYGYFQIDSWWYPKAKTNNLLNAFRGGSMKWEPIPELFPKGLPAFQEELGLPLVAHNRWYNYDTPYCDRYQCVYGHGDKQPALPIEPEFWDEIMDNAVEYGVSVYEQDWLVTQMDLIPWLRADIDNAELWFDSMVKAADARGLTMQLCMASPGFFLQQMKHFNVTHVRTSGDYLAGGPKTYWWPKFHKTSMLAYATGMYPWKDVHMSSSGQRLLRSERWPLEETLIANLSAGPVGPGDKLGTADRELLMRTCRSDGVLLKPDLPAMPIELMFVDNKKPWIVTTKSSHKIGDTFYVAAFNMRPGKTRDRSVTFEELGIAGSYAIYNWRTREVILKADGINFGKMPKNDAFYYALCPMLDCGLAVIGEADKFVTVSKKRFPEISYDNGVLSLTVEGVPGGVVPISMYVSCDERAASKCLLRDKVERGEQRLVTMEVTIPGSGRTVLAVE
jgi:hypothetical protein